MTLEQRSKELWKDEYNRQAWLKAILLVRSTKKGWLLDKQVNKNESVR